jgi:hypothetical protein
VQRNDFLHNADWCRIPGKAGVFIKFRKHVQAGAEIFIQYQLGKNPYWNKLAGIRTASTTLELLINIHSQINYVKSLLMENGINFLNSKRPAGSLEIRETVASGLRSGRIYNGNVSNMR